MPLAGESTARQIQSRLSRFWTTRGRPKWSTRVVRVIAIFTLQPFLANWDHRLQKIKFVFSRSLIDVHRAIFGKQVCTSGQPFRLLQPGKEAV